MSLDPSTVCMGGPGSRGLLAQLDSRRNGPLMIELWNALPWVALIPESVAAPSDGIGDRREHTDDCARYSN